MVLKSTPAPLVKHTKTETPLPSRLLNRFHNIHRKFDGNFFFSVSLSLSLYSFAILTTNNQINQKLRDIYLTYRMANGIEQDSFVVLLCCFVVVFVDLCCLLKHPYEQKRKTINKIHRIKSLLFSLYPRVAVSLALSHYILVFICDKVRLNNWIRMDKLKWHVISLATRSMLYT